jgi:dolichyl-diphosphooligosaccharide--protein glycosyltransferase
MSAAMLLIGADTQLLHAVAFWLPPALGSLAVLAIYLVGSRLTGSRLGGAAAALILAVLPGHIIYTFVAELDHHFLEPIICLAVIGAALGGNQSLRVRDMLAAAAGLVVGLLLWRGAVIFWGLAYFALILQLWLDGRLGRDTRRLNVHITGSCLLAAGALATVVGAGVFRSPEGMHFGIISWFHVLLLSGIALASATAHLFFARPVHRRKLILGVIVAGSVLAAAPPTWRLLSEFISGFQVIFGQDPWLDSISELRPMLFPKGTLDLLHATETLSALYWLAPLAVVMAIRRWRRSGFSDFGALILAVSIALLAILPLFRERYVHLAAIAVALTGGFLLDWLLERFQWKKGAGGFFGVLVLTMLFLPVSTFLVQIPRMGLTLDERVDLPMTLRWMRAQTPRTSNFDRPDQPPEYGVMANWDLGAYIVYLAERPSIATNFGWETHGLWESAAFLTATEPATAAGILEENGARFLVLSDESAAIEGLRDSAVFGGIDESNIELLPATPFDPRMTMHHRLFFFNGGAFMHDQQGELVPALGRYRLVFRSPNGPSYPGLGKTSFFKVFEVVPGALIEGRAEPGSEVSLGLDLYLMGRKVFTYQDTVQADTKGVFTMRVPYATDQPSGIFTTASAYSIVADKQRLAVSVPAAAIAGGMKLAVAANIAP